MQYDNLVNFYPFIQDEMSENNSVYLEWCFNFSHNHILISSITTQTILQSPHINAIEVRKASAQLGRSAPP